MTLNQSEPFPASTNKTWQEAAQKELKGTDPYVKLSSSMEGIPIKPYYDSSDVERIASSHLSPSSDPFLGPRAWYNMPVVHVEKAKTANKIALAHLNNGADGILFSMDSQVPVAELLENIELPYCSTFFLVDNEVSTLIPEFEQYVQTKKYNLPEITGGIFWKKVPKNPKALIDTFENWKRFFPLGIQVNSDNNPVSQISSALLKAVDLLDTASPSKMELHTALSSFAFSFPLGPDFFMEIAKLKAFRRLWLQLTKAYDSTYSHPFAPFIHASSPVWANETYSPNGNMLKSTTTAIAAIAGGCDGLTIEPEDNGQTFKSRISRNVSTILREESLLNRTADATAGSYYLETLIDQLARAGWAEFQNQVG